MKPQAPLMPLDAKLAYALPALALAVVGIPVYVYIPKFYTDVVGVDIAVVGYLLFGVRIFDAVTDPLIGWWSDRFRSAMGRRRPFMITGAVFLAVAMFFLFNPPRQASEGTQTLWLAVWIYTLFLFWTLTAVPYESLGPELTRDYNERTSLFALRDGFLIAGTLLAAAAPALIKGAFGIEQGPEGERKIFSTLALGYIPLLIGACAWCVLRLREARGRPSTRRTSLKDGLALIRHNRPFMVLLAAFAISALGANLPAALILYYVEYVLMASYAEVFLLAYFVTGIVFLPLWIKVARRWGKKKAWLMSMAVNTMAFLGVFLLGEGDARLYGILVVASGIGFGATLALPSALQADVIDYDELISGKRREGHYVGLWSVAKKLSAAVGLGIGLSALGAAGYMPNTQQSETVVWVIRCFYALIPSLCNMIAMVIALRYPLDSGLHEQILSAIDAREKGMTVVDPVTGQTLPYRPLLVHTDGR
jgi:GPH family glycoside/pentoside/hexuronide:cation symporter